MVNGRTVAEDMAARHEERNGEPPQWPCQFCGKFIDCCSCSFRASDVVIAMRKLSDAAPLWISVAERLPEFGDAVLVYIPFVRYCVARRNRTDWNLNGRAQFDGTEYWVWVDDAGCLDVLPTHWMPLPAPPAK